MSGLNGPPKSLNILAGLRNKVHVQARGDRYGINKNKDGSRGNEAVLSLPCRTIVRELHTQKVAGELITQN